jgi:hypothetical protein
MILQHVPRAMGGKPTPSQIFEGDHEELEVRKFGNIDFPKPFVSFVRFVVRNCVSVYATAFVSPFSTLDFNRG